MSRPDELIRRLALERHPEGGYYRRVHRAAAEVALADGRQRPALTVIHYLLCEAEYSHWHRVASDEVWHFQEGAPLDLYWLQDERLCRHRLGPWGEADGPLVVVPAGCWQGARSSGAYTLSSCIVGPGFDFADFELLTDPSPGLAARLAPAGLDH